MMPLPRYISLWGPALPLLIWTLVSAICGLALIIQALVLMNRGRGGMRWLALVPLSVSATAFVLANQIGTAYYGIVCPPYTVSALGCFDRSLATIAVAQFQPLGWAVLAMTVVHLVVGVVGQRRAHLSASGINADVDLTLDDDALTIR